jgi:hypothetical protein
VKNPRSCIEVRGREYLWQKEQRLHIAKRPVYSKEYTFERIRKGNVTTMKRLILFLAIAAIITPAVYPQGQAADSPRQVKSGEWFQLGTTIKVRAVRGTKVQFNGVKLQGSPVEVLIEFDGGKNSNVAYKLTPDAKSDIYLMKGDQEIAPVAVMEDFPSWGADNDKEIEVLNPKESVGNVTLNFSQKGSVSLLFDVPAEQMKPPQNFKLVVNSIKANGAKFSFVVNPL